MKYLAAVLEILIYTKVKVCLMHPYQNRYIERSSVSDYDHLGKVSAFIQRERLTLLLLMQTTGPDNGIKLHTIKYFSVLCRCLKKVWFLCLDRVLFRVVRLLAEISLAIRNTHNIKDPCRSIPVLQLLDQITNSLLGST
jgi:hypothetical protein